MATPQERTEAAVTKVTGMFGGDPPKPEEIEAPGAPGAPEIEGEDTTAGAEPPAAEAAGQEITQPQSEDVEVEIEGEKYLVPKKISDRFIQHADYTRKTMDIAELRRVSLAEQQQIQLERAFSAAVAPESQQSALLDAQIKAYDNVDWLALDAETMTRHKAHFDMLSHKRGELEKTISAKRHEFSGRLEGAKQEAVIAGTRYIEQHIPKWTAVEKTSLFNWGMTRGYTQDEMRMLIDPRLVVDLWKASKYDELQASKPAILKRAQNAAPAVRPGATQPKPNRVAQLTRAVKTATTTQGKKLAAEELFAAKFGGR